ncbi:putative mediator of RNA polymerase II transcription subunit 26 [Battus philenor]|uniref:putative mediator of RNA polymerase II transcription subunit 26 n=1 Tax=Battus philenor TaxID=42288 RepID=UPI0035D07681
MQQPIYQDQQSNQQNASQQMLLCPVRLVYETQILVQPGEQIQPNQTIFINPQNPPPWIQNRQQNQVLYVQQMAPNNFIQHVQQQTGQNQFYMHQNYNNIQQVMPQQIVSQTQHKEVRTANVQMQNVLQRNPVQSLQPNTATYNPNLPNEANISTNLPNYGIMTQNYTNVPNQIGQNQLNFVPANVNKQVLTNVHPTPRPTVTNTVTLPRNIEMHQNLYRPVIQQTYQHENNSNQTPLPQSVNMVPMQNVTSIQNPVPDNNAGHNMTQIRPMQPQLTNTNIPQPAMSTVSNYTNERIIRKVATVAQKGNFIANNNVVSTGPKTVQTFSYRPIQPRPQQQRNMTPSLMPTNSQMLPPMQSTTINNNIKTQNYPITMNYIKTEPNAMNRKRKSESPDEIQKKIAISSPTQRNKAAVSIPTTNTFNSIGINTVTMQKANNKPISTINNYNMNSNRTNENIKDNNQPVDNKIEKESTQTSETEKLLRNTVFTQARNRVLADRNEVNTNVKEETKASEIKIESNHEKPTEDSIKNDETVKEVKQETVNIPAVETKEEKVCKIIDSDSKPDVKEINLLGNSKTNDKNGFVLTHVLDGYVIQESNIPFPIRRPLKERTQPNIDEKEVKKEDSKKSKAETNSKIFNLSLLHLDETDAQKRLTGGDDKDTKDNVNKKDNPFSELVPQTIKTWTVEQLTAHLLKYDWEETVSVLREHEIDGESLFLVSKNQLVTIGVNEDHAVIICDFVKN